jgi:hypothetical protein
MRYQNPLSVLRRLGSFQHLHDSTRCSGGSKDRGASKASIYRQDRRGGQDGTIAAPEPWHGRKDCSHTKTQLSTVVLTV